MGETRKLGIGYGMGFELSGQLAEDADEACDIEYLIEDNYSLLSHDSSGNGWTGHTEDMILVTAMSTSDYSVSNIDVSALVAKEPAPEALSQLKEFCDKYGFEFKPGWKVFNYVG